MTPSEALDEVMRIWARACNEEVLQEKLDDFLIAYCAEHPESMRMVRELATGRGDDTNRA